MAKNEPRQTAGRTWHQIEQPVVNRLNAHGLRRLAFNAFQSLLLVTLCCGVIWGVWEIGASLGDGTSAIHDPVGSPPLREVVLVNDADGVLTQEWVEETLALRPGVTLMELDLFALRERLLAHGQVRYADLRRDFPGTLVVTLRERLPVLKVRVQEGDGPARVMLVARDGVVYRGACYDSMRIGALPYLDGVRLSRNRSGGFLPVEGMADVDRLLQTVQNAAPMHYTGWRVVSLERLADYDEIVVRTRTIPEVVFSRRLDFSQQLARLDYIADYARLQPDSVVQRVDLSLGADVPVSFETSDSGFISKPRFPTSNPRTRRDL